MLKKELYSVLSAANSEGIDSPQMAAKKARRLRMKIRKGQIVSFTDEQGRRFRLKVTSVLGSKVFMEHPTYGTLMADLVDIYPASSGKGARWEYKMPYDGQDAVVASQDGTMEILQTKDKQDLIKKIYDHCISDTDYSRYPDFITKMDDLLVEYQIENPLGEDEEEDENDEFKDSNFENEPDEDDVETDDDLAEEEAETEVKAFVLGKRFKSALASVHKINSIPELGSVKDYVLDQRFKLNIATEKNCVFAVQRNDESLKVYYDYLKDLYDIEYSSDRTGTVNKSMPANKILNYIKQFLV